MEKDGGCPNWTWWKSSHTHEYVLPAVSSIIYASVGQIFSRIPVTGSKGMWKHNFYRERASPRLLDCKVWSTSTVLLQLMLVTFKPFYWWAAISKILKWWLKTLFTEHPYLAMKFLTWLMQFTSTCFVLTRRGEKQERTTGAKTAGKSKSPNLSTYLIKNSNSMLSAALVNCEIPRRANGRAGHEQTKR